MSKRAKPKMIDGVLVIPRGGIFTLEGGLRIPTRVMTIARYTDADGTTFTVQKSFFGVKRWWLATSKGGWKQSAVHGTTAKDVAAAWENALQTGAVRLA